MRFLTVAMVVLMMVGGASTAFASDPAEVELGRLVPGVALEEDELGTFYGTGTTESSRGLEGESYSANSDMRIRRRIERARRIGRSPSTRSARDAARAAYGIKLPRVSSGLDGEGAFLSEFSLSF